MLGNAKRLNESQRLELVSKLSQSNPPSYEASHDSTEWGCYEKVCAKREVMHKRSALMSEDTKNKNVGASARRLTELEGKV